MKITCDKCFYYEYYTSEFCAALHSNSTVLNLFDSVQIYWILPRGTKHVFWLEILTVLFEIIFHFKFRTPLCCIFNKQKTVFCLFVVAAVPL